MPLDQPNGPTLTIEGRDAAGNARTWYVRLWNYAEGTPEDARITLRFSDLQSGYGLPGEPVHPSDIDRMFISLAPPAYVPGSTDRLAARADGWAEISEIACWGDHAMLTVGDVVLPAHGEGMATAYDDAFNQTPARLVRQVEQLGYRGEVIHYVGMSHFFALREGTGEDAGRLLVGEGGALCEPARRWHESFCAELAKAEFEPILSLSYELLAEHCPATWQQRAHDGSPARTGWEPPSALLSPANSDAMGWLQDVARNFVALAEAASLPVKLQIGEPWWWVKPDDFAPCLYDDAAVAALGGSPVAITDMRAPMSQAQTGLLDAAGVLLSNSTAALAQAVRDAASGPAELLLLIFHADAARPRHAGTEAREPSSRLGSTRHSTGFRSRITTGSLPGPMRCGVQAMPRWMRGLAIQSRTRITYRVSCSIPPMRKRSGRASTLRWTRPRRAACRARFVWALPQVARDGYTRLAPQPEDDVNAFDDVPYPLELGRDAAVSPEFSTSVAVTASGHERRNALWSDARMRYDVGPGIRSEEELATLIAFFRARHGPATAFRLRDPYDFSSNGMSGSPGPADQMLGARQWPSVNLPTDQALWRTAAHHNSPGCCIDQGQHRRDRDFRLVARNWRQNRIACRARTRSPGRCRFPVRRAGALCRGPH